MNLRRIIPYFLFFGCILIHAQSFSFSFKNTQPSIVSNTPETVVLKNGTNYQITGGIPNNHTLLHLFQQFNLYKGEQAYFKDSGFINTIAKVNGGDPSWINGHLKSSASHFFLINPNGLVFGPDATLDVAGSFYATTADEINVENASVFNKNHPQQESILHMAPTISFGFLDNDVADIEIRGDTTQSLSGLHLKDNQTLSLIGGDVRINNKAIIKAPGGSIHLISLDSKGTVKLNLNEINVLNILQLGDIEILEKSTLDTSGPGGGNILIRANQLNVNNSRIQAVTNGSINGGLVDISVNDLLFKYGGYLDSSTNFTGDAGTIKIVASGDVTFQGENDLNQLTGIALRSLSTLPDAGNAGTITIEASNVLFLDGASIDSATLGTGDGGEIQIHARKKITYMGNSFLGRGSHMEVASLYLFEGAGPAGSIRLEAKDIHFGGIAFINSTSDGPGMSGHIDILAHETFSVFGERVGSRVGLIIAGTWQKRPNGGPGGNVSIRAKNMDLKNLAMINTSTDGEGMGGYVDIVVTETATFDRNATIQVVTSSKDDFAGDGGNLSLKAKKLVLKNGSTINSTSFGHGKAGKIYLDITEELLLIDSSITGEVSLDSNGGNGNLVEIHAGRITLLNDSKISTTSANIGDAGDIYIETNMLSLSGKSCIISKTTNAVGGNAGKIDINTQTLFIDGSDAMISTSSNGSGMGGSITINAEQIDLKSGKITSESLYAPNTPYDSFVQFQENILNTGDIVEFPYQRALIWYYVYNNQLFYMDKQFYFIRSVDELYKLNQTYDVNNGDVAWFIDSDGHTTQYVFSDWYRGKGWAKVNETLEPILFDNIEDIYQLEDDYEPGETPPYENGARLKYVNPLNNKTAMFVYCYMPRTNDVGIFVKSVRLNQFLIKHSNELSALKTEKDLKNQAVAMVQNDIGEIETTYILHSGEWVRVNKIRQFDNSEYAIKQLHQAGDIANLPFHPSNRIYTGKEWIHIKNTYDINDPSELTLIDGKVGDIATVANNKTNIKTYLFIDNQWKPFFQSGNAGTIVMNASKLNMDQLSVISTSTTGNGHAGNICLNAREINLNHESQITSESLSLFSGGQAGFVDINQSKSSGLLTIQNISGVLTDSVSSGGGKISIRNNRTILLNSSITTNVKDGSGNGGDISLSSKQFVLNRSRVSANAIDGDGGAIFIVSDFFIKSSETIIEASSERGNEGTVKIDAPDLNIDSKMMNLPNDFLDASQWIKTACNKRDRRNASRLIFKKYVVPPKLNIYQSSPH